MRLIHATRSGLCLLPLALTGCEGGGVSGAARTTFVVFLLFLAGTFFINPQSTNFLRNPRFTALLDRHIRRLYTLSFILGAGVALTSLLVALVISSGLTEAVCIGLIMSGLCFVLIAFCLKRWEESHAELWLRRSIQILYNGLICCSAVYFFIQEP